jgi:hypothetical protein
MAVRIKIQVVSKDRGLTLESVGLINTGFESSTPQILLPGRAAEILGFLPALPSGVQSRVYETAGGVVRFSFLEEMAKVKVITKDRQTEFVSCSVIISEHEREILLNDAVVEQMGIEIIKVRSGKWRFFGEADLRDTSQPHYW